MVVGENKTFVLIHGAWHGAWCWTEVAKELRLNGHNVVTPDLPGHGDHTMNISGIDLKTYVDYVQGLVINQDKSVVLVGHSMAGIIISQLAEYIPDKIDKLVYVAAYLPGNNSSLTDEARLAETPGVSVALITDYNNNQIRLCKSEVLDVLFYNCCTTEQSEWAISKLKEEEPLKPFTDLLKLSVQNFGMVRKLYIECLQDNSITIDQQRRMHKKYITEVISIDTDHSPFISRVEELVKAISS